MSRANRIAEAGGHCGQGIGYSIYYCSLDVQFFLPAFAALTHVLPRVELRLHSEKNNRWPKMH